MSVYKGENVVLKILDADEWKPIACSQSCTLTTTTNTAEKSTIGSGIWQEFKGMSMTWGVECSGLCSLDMNLTVSQLRAYQFLMQPVFITFVSTDENGLVETISGFILITSVGETGNVTDAAGYTMTGLGTGELGLTDVVIDPVIPTTGEPGIVDLHWFYYDGAGGEFDFTNGALINKNIIQVLRDGVNYRKVTGIPTADKDYSYDSSTGKIQFSTTLPPLEAGEMVDVLYADV